MKKSNSLSALVVFIMLTFPLYSQVEEYDLDNDFTVGISDFLLFLPDYGLSCPTGCVTDFNSDGLVNTDDFLLFLPAYGQSYSTGTFTDSRDGTTYSWVKIGDQVWMDENLAYLPAVSTSSDASLSDPVYYVYGYQGTAVPEAKATTNYTTYGVLYNWSAATTSCPDGWHLPTDQEWEDLAVFISDDNGGYTNTVEEWDNVGRHLKATTGWGGGGNGTDDYGFSALPGGLRNSTNFFDRLLFITNFWSTTESGTTSHAWVRGMNSNYSELYRSEFIMDYGFSVRCIRD